RGGRVARRAFGFTLRAPLLAFGLARCTVGLARLIVDIANSVRSERARAVSRARGRAQHAARARAARQRSTQTSAPRSAEQLRLRGRGEGTERSKGRAGEQNPRMRHDKSPSWAGDIRLRGGERTSRQVYSRACAFFVINRIKNCAAQRCARPRRRAQ